MNGCIFDIQGFSVHDGPGCRTVVFMKGCSMNCRWCSNPEGISNYPVPLYNPDKCICDGLCVNACGLSAISRQQSAGKSTNFKLQTTNLIINRDVCRTCKVYACAEACNTGAIKIVGYYISVDDLYLRLQRDRDYWGQDGGITLTGGEPFSQPEFATELLKRCYQSYIHTAIETCGNVPWKYYEDAIPFIEWIFYDLKHINPAKHKEWTGVDNRLILENARKLAKSFKGRIIIRMPVIPGFNDTPEELLSIAGFMNSEGLKEINILPLHHLGREKYNLLGLPYFDKDIKIPSQEELSSIKSLFEEKGLICHEAYKTPF